MRRSSDDGGHAARPARTIGRLAPLVLAAWLVVDIGARFLPLSWFRIPVLLQAIRFPPPHAPFAPNVRLRSARYEGETALAANRPATERRPPLAFSTDALGFRRNPYLAPGGASDVLFLLGASFTYGAGLSDEETLPAAFTRISGVGAYNGGRFHTDDRTDLRKLDWLLARLPARPGVAVLVYLDYENFEPPPPPGRSRVVAAAERVSPALVPAAEGVSVGRRRAQWLREVAARWLRVSPLDVASTRLLKALGDDRLLPNQYAEQVAEMRLPDGSPLLFREFELGIARRARSNANVDATADYFAWWRDALARRGIESRVLLVPTRYTLYGPWLDQGRQRAAAARAAEELGAVERALSARGVRSINALPVLGPRVESEVRSGVLSFYREDNHWNAWGVQQVAHTVAAALAAENGAAPGPVAAPVAAAPASPGAE